MPKTWPTSKDGKRIILSDIEPAELRHEIIDLTGAVHGNLSMLKHPQFYSTFHPDRNDPVRLSNDYVELAESVVNSCKRLVDLGFPSSLNLNRVPISVQRIMVERAMKIGLIGKTKFIGMAPKLLTRAKQAKLEIKAKKKGGKAKLTIRARLLK